VSAATASCRCCRVAASHSVRSVISSPFSLAISSPLAVLGTVYSLNGIIQPIDCTSQIAFASVLDYGTGCADKAFIGSHFLSIEDEFFFAFAESGNHIISSLSFGPYTRISLIVNLPKLRTKRYSPSQ
jgi:hypothetical protein